jgi:transcriptional regulator with XRE-family HTH domain
MATVGARLREIRQQLQLSLRAVEEHSRRLAQKRGDSSYHVSASWLGRLERYEHELTVNKLLALSEIYELPVDQLLKTLYPRSAETQSPDQLSIQNATELRTEGLRKVQAGRSRAAKPFPGLALDETTLLPTENGPPDTPYRVAVVGKLHLTSGPMIPAGSIVQIDTRKCEISPKQDWAHSLQRPIYFLNQGRVFLRLVRI